MHLLGVDALPGEIVQYAIVSGAVDPPKSRLPQIG
jgi:hypothetical protein